MDFLGRILSGVGLQASYPPDHDYWYQPAGVMTASGVTVSTEGARKLSAWFRGRDLLATSLAMLPLHLFQRLPDDEGANTARAHPVYDLLHRKPNGWQDSFIWRRQQMYHLIDGGNAYNLIVSGSRGVVDQLHPIDPATVTPELLPTKRLLYHVRDPKTSRVTTLLQDEVFHLKCHADDGVLGRGVLEYARDAIGTAMATESYAARIYAKGALNGGTISVPGKMTDEASRRMALSFVTQAGEWHVPKVLEQGATWTPPTLTPEDCQMLLSRKFSVDDIARWLGVPPHMIGSLDRATFSNIEHQGQEFVTYSLGPWLSLWEFAINDQLILAPQTYYAEFTRDALVRGDIAARWNAYQMAVSTGTFTRNEVRRMENKNRLPGLDHPLHPAHLAGTAPARRPTAPAAPAPAEDAETAARLQRGHAIATASAQRLLRKEVTAIQKAAVKHAASEDAFVAWVCEFYHAHATVVADTLSIDRQAAEHYCAGQAAQVVNGDWTSALARWQTPEFAAGLAALALDNEVAA